MTVPSETKIISRKVEFQGWHTLETVVVQPPSLKHAGHVQPMKREVYRVGTCAVVVLYQPETDQILLTEQFRIGALLAGDDNPWLFEVAAGMVDEGEDAETAVRREALEETGCHILDLEFIGKNYPSPGCTTEVHMHYCGRISAAEAGHYGLEAEGEEIRTHLVPAADAIRMLDEGRITNAASVICLHWFARNHDRLRKKWGNK